MLCYHHYYDESSNDDDLDSGSDDDESSNDDDQDSGSDDDNDRLSSNDPLRRKNMLEQSLAQRLTEILIPAVCRSNRVAARVGIAKRKT